MLRTVLFFVVFLASDDKFQLFKMNFEEKKLRVSENRNFFCGFTWKILENESKSTFLNQFGPVYMALYFSSFPSDPFLEIFQVKFETFSETPLFLFLKNLEFPTRTR